MITIAIIAQKGGVGKSTTAYALGAGLAKYHAARVLYVDLDAQGNLSRTMEADSSGTTGTDVLEAITGRADLKHTIQRTPHGDIVASSPALSGADREPALSKVGREYRLRKALEAVSGDYDYCIVDTPPALSVVTVNALTAANRAIIPAQADDYSLEAIERLRETIETIQTYCNPSLRVDGILLTRFNGRAVISREIAEMIAQAAEKLGSRLYETRIRECTAVKEAQAVREDIFSYAPRSNASKDYRALVEEVAGTAKQE